MLCSTCPFTDSLYKSRRSPIGDISSTLPMPLSSSKPLLVTPTAPQAMKDAMHRHIAARPSCKTKAEFKEWAFAFVDKAVNSVEYRERRQLTESRYRNVSSPILTSPIILASQHTSSRSKASSSLTSTGPGSRRRRSSCPRRMLTISRPNSGRYRRISSGTVVPSSILV